MGQISRTVIHSVVGGSGLLWETLCVLSGGSVNSRTAVRGGCLGPPRTVETKSRSLPFNRNTVDDSKLCVLVSIHLVQKALFLSRDT